MMYQFGIWHSISRQTVVVAFRTVRGLLKLEIREPAIRLCVNNCPTGVSAVVGGRFVCPGAGGDRRTDRCLAQPEHVWKASRRQWHCYSLVASQDLKPN